MVHGRVSTKAAISIAVCCGLPNSHNIIIELIIKIITRTQLLDISEKTIQSSNAIRRETHSIAIRTTQVIFNHKGRIRRLKRLLILQGNFFRAKAAITVRKIDNTHINMLVTRRAIFPTFSPIQYYSRI